MSRPQAIKLGPFTGGLNNAVVSSNLEDSELSVCINFEVDIDGSLVCRPPIQETTNHLAVAGTGRLKVIGRGRFSSGGIYIFASNSTGTYAFNGTVWSTVQANLQSNCSVQYNDKVYFIPKPGTKATQNGGFWDPVGGFVADANMPEGMSALSHKSRIFVVPGTFTSTNPSRLQFTDVITSTTLSWPGINFIDISPGDESGSLTDIIVYNDNLLLTKDNAIYVLAYDISPADAVLRIVNDKIGTAETDCITTYENSVYIFNEGSVYEMTNYEFKNISLNLTMELDETVPTGGGSWASPIFCKTMGDRLLVRFYNKIYAYNFLTLTWSEWQSANANLAVFGPMFEFSNDNDLTEVNRTFYMGSSLATDHRMYKIVEDHTATDTESTLTSEVDITCQFRTKDFEFDAPFVWKRLMWWGAHLISKRTVNATLLPNYEVGNETWGFIESYAWNEFNTWDDMLENIVVANVSSGVVSSSDGGFSRAKMYKFLKSIRFKSVMFDITLTDDGSTVNGPCRVFSLAAIVGTKQLVTKDIN